MYAYIHIYVHIYIDNKVNQSETQYVNKTDFIDNVLGINPSSGKNK